MLRKLLATVSSRRPDEAISEDQPAKLPRGMGQFKPMVPLQPPPALNDDVMQQLYEKVEQALRAGGHIR